MCQITPWVKVVCGLFEIGAFHAGLSIRAWVFGVAVVTFTVFLPLSRMVGFGDAKKRS
jgi:hypothetical protein